MISKNDGILKRLKEFFQIVCVGLKELQKVQQSHIMSLLQKNS